MDLYGFRLEIKGWGSTENKGPRRIQRFFGNVFSYGTCKLLNSFTKIRHFKCADVR